ncbi:MAG: glutamine amidotransferase, partial [Planctomycetota bacterium]
FYYPIADSYWLVVGVAAALLALVVLVGPGRNSVSLRRRLTLALIRCGIILLLVLGMLRPTLVYTETHKEKATLVLLIDQSRSMLVRDSLNNKTRWESLLATLEDSVPALRSLGRDFEIKAYTFDAEIHPLEVKDGKLVLPDSPSGNQTAIGANLDDVLNQENGKRLLGIVILTDGRQQALAPRDASVQDIAAKLRHQSYPVFPVVFGQSRGLGGVQDVAVVDFPPPASVFVKTEMAIHGEIKVSGYVNHPIPLRVFMETPEGKMEQIAQKEITATADGQLLPVDFTYTPETPGEFKLTLEAVAQPGELVTTNNQQSSFVQVLKGGLHVLYIEGDLRVEQKFLRRSLDASRDIKVDSIRLDPRHKETKPSNLMELLKPGKYDVFILGDVDSTAFEPAELEQLKETVSRGKGLIMLGGFHTYGPGGYFNTALAEVLPVDMDRLERQLLDTPVRDDVQLPGPLRMQPTPRSLRHFALALAAGAQENAAAWAKLPPLEGANRFMGVKPSATILAEADGKEGRPLLVSHEFGSGRVIAFAGDSTWRWTMRGFDSAHKRFWRQIVLWLARKDQMAQGNVWVRLDNTRFFPGNRVEFTAGAQSPNNEPITDAEFKADVLKPDNKRSPAVLIRKDEQLAASFRETQLPGDYTIEVTATRKGELLGTARARFIVSQQDLELDNASSDLDGMKGVAKSSGGEIIEPERLPKWLAELMNKTDYLDVKQETKKTLWDRWSLFLSLVLLLTAEWFLRKRWGLV